MTHYTFTLTEQHLPKLAHLLAKNLDKGNIIALWGDLGTGKTTFARTLIQALTNENVDVPSPTFTLVQIYDSTKGEIWHCDLYRLKAAEEFIEIGLEEAFHSSICLIEWPERLGDFLPHHRIDMVFKIINETTREITVTLVGPHDTQRAALQTTLL
ncbi:MAG: tRNA (adenosine(37)-N6)-threonylcarbamoyltransferase complex ATPase subunit type 1 TsaE [Alphaproteobacteria bacterium]|nr:tRNA (adenosine(37)-N6)-threonylcarbamoyltransferase complex ATPase subunit type 1 TsaE [Alphaproteobacteria bacterium]